MKKVINFWSLAMIIAVCVGVSSCSSDKDEGGGSGNSSGNNAIVGTWVDLSGKIGKYGSNQGSTAYWEFKANGEMYTNADAISTSTYVYDHKTKELCLWGCVRKVTVEWISNTEIKAEFIGHLKKQ